MPARSKTRKAFPAGSSYRFWLGIALTALSVLAVLLLTLPRGATVSLYTASSIILPGERITHEKLTLIEIEAERLSAHYLQAGDLPAAGLISKRSIDKDELIPLSSLSSSAPGSSLIVLPLSTPLPATVQVGDTVDIWAVSRTTGNATSTALPPRVIAAQAVVVGIPSTSGLMSSASRNEVELRIDASAVAGVLTALSVHDEISALP